MNAAYVSSARITASAVANRVNFDIDEIEDIKMAVSEACTYILKTAAAHDDSHFDIQFQLSENQMEIKIVTEGVSQSQHAGDEMSLLMIKALVDEFKMETTGGIIIKMIKLHKDTLFR
jgi:serine/threonine-protein kinase RsbW